MTTETFYELAPDMAAEKKARYLAVNERGEIRYTNDVPKDVDLIHETRGNA